MKTRSDSLIRFLAAATIVMAAAMMMTPVSARTPSMPLPDFERPVAVQPDADPEEAMLDTEFGVDPMVTGPVSDEFRARQARLGCLEAKWPNVPAACYPDAN